MKKHQKKLSAVLSATILLSSFALTAYPLNFDAKEISAEKVGESSGNLGYNVKWTLSDDGTLSITGEGDMDSLKGTSYYPWYSSRKNIKKIVIEKGITSIGNCAFSQYNTVEEISIPEGVESIGQSSLMGLKNVNSITLPTTLKSIGETAFYNCASLEEVIIPEGVTHIGKQAFGYCSSLSSVNISKSAQEIGEGVFVYCNKLENIEISSENKNFEMNGNCLLDKKNKVLLWGADEITIPNGTVRIGSYSFTKKEGLKEVVLPDTVESIGDYAFEYCYDIEKIILSKSLKEIGNSSFHGCEAVSEIILPDSLETIGALAFTSCTSLAKIETGSNIRYIGGGDGGSPFYNTAVYNDENNWENGALYIGKCLIEVDKTKLPEEYVVKNGTTVIASYVFSGSHSLKSLSLPESLLGTGKYAFSYCTSLTELAIPNSITKMEDGVLLGCCSLTSVDFPENLEYIGKFALSECISVKELNLPEKVSFIDNEAFSYGNGFEKITVSEKNETYKSAGNCLIEKESKKLILGCSKSVIPSDGSVVSIGENAFIHCDKLTSVVIPDSIKNIGSNAFYKCTSLESVALGKGVEIIEGSAFCSCSSLKNVSGGENLKSIGSIAFLRTLYYETPENWENNALYLNTFLLEYKGTDTTYEVKEGTTVIAFGAFKEKGLENVTIPDSVIGISDYAFSGIDATEIKLSNSLEYIGNSAFESCSSLKKINIPDNVKKIGDYAFYNCTSLVKITLPASVEEIGKRAVGIYYDTEAEEDKKVETFEVNGIKGTATEVYAEENGLAFVAVDITTVENNYYYIDKINKVMPNVKEGTKASDVVSTLKEYGLSVTVTDKEGNVLREDSYVGTGCIITDADGNEYTTIVCGDVDGNGMVDSTDYLQIKQMFLNGLTLENEYHSAADADDSGDISSTDYLQIKGYFLEKFDLYN